MKFHRIHRTQLIPISLDEAWAFFSSPQNLDAITPDFLSFRIINGASEKMYSGQLVEYRIKAFPGVWLKWLTELKHIEEGHCFVDEQRFGPYKFWYHRHTFTPVEGGVRVEDLVTYSLPFGPLGELVRVLHVKRQLEEIFDYRIKAMEERFGPWPSPPAGG